MGSLNPRLERLYQAAKDGKRLPILVTAHDTPTVDLITQVTSIAGAQVAYHSAFANILIVTADYEAAKKLAKLPGVKEIAYDEPIHIV